ncbi:glycosyl transferase family 2 [Propionicimonas paludicola]|uniref:Glycosyl transferase family 2 n=1 Tax=Propionicimonas paludicola TaxID=185243 RepID=A0A2A9CUD1_9ACTN|nr:glycosyltransferase family A protein [Propionicimonas paludicola]PFG17736.1 glycosyl transferase family 2 [Propionicimonas paludicola]
MSDVIPKVSVVIPAYNNAAYLAEAIESVLAQTYPDLELIIADHSSADLSAEIAAGYAGDSRVRLLEPTPAGGGAARNWNRVSEAARGTYLKLLCGDDILEPEALSRQVAALDANPSAVIAAARRRLIDAHGAVFLGGRGLNGLRDLVPGEDAIRATVRAGTNLFGEPGSVLFRRSVLAETGWWDATNPYLIDQATYVRVLHHGDLWASADVLASFRLTGSQWSARLIGQQAGQAIAFHHRERAANPGRISAADVALGDLNARKTAVMRRASYLVLGSKRLSR